MWTYGPFYLDVIMTGETDLCLSMGYELTPSNPPEEVIEAIQRISSLAKAAGKWQGGRIRPSTGGVKDMMLRGIQMIGVGLDAWALRDCLTAAAKEAEASS
jgi:2-keto-3-deoxy-L-rhamnonate aldolase RhmA